MSHSSECPYIHRHHQGIHLWGQQSVPMLADFSISYSCTIFGKRTASVGQYAIQLAHLSGYKVATVASPHNHGLVKELGADVIFDVRVFLSHALLFPVINTHLTLDNTFTLLLICGISTNPRMSSNSSELPRTTRCILPLTRILPKGAKFSPLVRLVLGQEN